MDYKMNFLSFVLVTLAYLSCVNAGAFEELESNPELSQFLEIMSIRSWMKERLNDYDTVLFAPTNKAFQSYTGTLKGMDVYNHHLFETGKFFERVQFNSNSGISAGKNMLWFTKLRKPNSTNGEYEYFVNNAKILNYESPKKYTDSKVVILFIVDQLLPQYFKKDSYAAMDNPQSVNIQESLNSFKDVVKKFKAQDLFKRPGGNTFFIPVGDDGDSFPNLNEVMVKAHVIPDKVLFTRSMHGVYLNKIEEDDVDIQVEISLVNKTNSMNLENELMIKSNTMITKTKSLLPRKGVSYSELVPGSSNILIENGVIHLIKKPLMVITQNVWDILEKERNGRLSKFFNYIANITGLEEIIKTNTEKTIFAPANEAFQKIPQDKLNESIFYTDIKKKEELVMSHMLSTLITSFDIKSNRDLPSMNNRQPLYFHVNGEGENRTLTVEGSGVNATVIDADIGGTNGIVHIINHILGVPFRSIFDKLKTDTKLSTTFNLGEESKWNEIFKKNNRNFTLFIPNNQAWNKIKARYPTTFKQLSTKGLFNDQMPKILDRHVILDQVLTQADLQDILEDKKKKWIHTKSLKLQIFRYKTTPPNESNAMSAQLGLNWADRNIQSNIVRPDVKATNGIIHVIDYVFMAGNDIVNGVSHPTVPSIVTTALISSITLFLAV